MSEANDKAPVANVDVWERKVEVATGGGRDEIRMVTHLIVCIHPEGHPYVTIHTSIRDAKNLLIQKMGMTVFQDHEWDAVSEAISVAKKLNETRKAAMS